MDDKNESPFPKNLHLKETISDYLQTLASETSILTSKLRYKFK